MFSEISINELNYRSAACINALISIGNIDYNRTCACIREGFEDLPSYIYQHYDTMCSNLWSSMSKFIELNKPIQECMSSNYPNLEEVYKDCENTVRSLGSNMDSRDSFIAVDVFRVKAPYHFLINASKINMNIVRYSTTTEAYSDLAKLTRENIDRYSKLSVSLTINDLYNMILELKKELSSLSDTLNENVRALDLKIGDVSDSLIRTNSYYNNSLAILKSETIYADERLASEQATQKSTILNTIDSLVLLANTFNRHVATYETQMLNLESAFQVLIDRDSYLAGLIQALSETQSSQNDILSSILDKIDDIFDFIDDVEDIISDLEDLIP